VHRRERGDGGSACFGTIDQVRASAENTMNIPTRIRRARLRQRWMWMKWNQGGRKVDARWSQGGDDVVDTVVLVLVPS
jgi:hypothetical protein